MYEQPDGTVKRGAASSGGSCVLSGGPHQKALVSQQEPRGNKGWRCGSRAVCWELWWGSGGAAQAAPRRAPSRPGSAGHGTPGPPAVLWPHLMAPCCTAGGLPWGHPACCTSRPAGLCGRQRWLFPGRRCCCRPGGGAGCSLGGAAGAGSWGAPAAAFPWLPGKAPAQSLPRGRGRAPGVCCSAGAPRDRHQGFPRHSQMVVRAPKERSAKRELHV